MISPYGESQIFEDYEEVVTDFAGATVNTDYRYTEAYDGSLPSAARTSMILAVNNGETSYEGGGRTPMSSRRSARTATPSPAPPLSPRPTGWRAPMSSLPRRSKVTRRPHRRL